ncbi:uncharacterized protein FTJAE_12120 [Fusarium tjaetaba]|uniref:Uncharacterized protein n=1 Tax=Fusarium tjaetaba TaxID=1567544 RepID=A0A8H5QQB5_9HYPO|nr:uncharacterized protein FTJAE_12120 [Fusarium tjaetaba]KAF5618853.1 hypothetical protein FTJAE_12120 [Fusarium tjaetaba]
MVWKLTLKEVLPVDLATNPFGNGGRNAEHSAATDQIEADAKALHYWEIPDESRMKIDDLDPDYQRYVAVEFKDKGSTKIRFIKEKWWTWYLCASKQLSVRDPDDDAPSVDMGTAEAPGISEDELPEALQEHNIKALDQLGAAANIQIPGQGQAKMINLCTLLRNCVTAEQVRKNAVTALELAGVKNWDESKRGNKDQSPEGRFRHFTFKKIEYGDKFFGYYFILDEKLDKTTLSVKEKYVKLKTADVVAISLTTKDVYLPESFIRNLAGGFDPTVPERKSKAGLAANIKKYEKNPLPGRIAEELEAKGSKRREKEAEKAERMSARKPFWARDADGRPFLVEVRDNNSVSWSPEAWARRFESAVTPSQEDKGWNRFINSELDIFILPTNESSVIRELVTDTKKRLRLPIDGEKILKPSTCKQNVKVIQLNNKDQLEESNGVTQVTIPEFGPLIKVGRSPFHDYETYIKKADWETYSFYRPSRPIFQPSMLSEVDQVLADKKTAYTAEKRSKLESLRKSAEAGKDRTRKRLEESLGEGDKAKLQTGRVIAIEVTASKIYAAATRRSEAPDQKEVMGDSATMTSQVPDNLIFGSSEANSLMTRYEKAWQSLVTKENARRTGQEKGQQRAYLVSQILPITDADHAKYEPIFAKKTQQSLPSYSKVPDWLCYKMRYSLHVFNYNGMGERRNATFETEFYPFQRPFFTKFEQELDIVLLESIYNLPKNAEVEDSQSSIKLNTNVQERQDHQVDNAIIEETIFQLTKSRKRQDIDLFIMPADFGGLVLMPPNKTYELMALNEKPHRSKEKGNTEGKEKSRLSLLQKKRLRKGQENRERHGGNSEKYDDHATEYEQSQGNSAPGENPEPRKIIKSEKKVGAVQKLSREPTFRTVEQKLSKRVKAQNAPKGASTFTLEPEVATECIGNDNYNTNTFPTESAFEAHERIWADLDAPGNISVGGLLLENAQIVTTLPDATEAIQAPTESAIGDLQSSSATVISYVMADTGLIPSSDINNSDGSALVTGMGIATAMDVAFEEEKKEPMDTQTSAAPVPGQYAVMGDFMLFGVMSVKIQNLQSLNTQGEVFRVSLTDDMALGKLVPCLKNSPMDAITLSKTTLSFRTHDAKIEQAGLTMSTTVHFSGVLQPVSEALSYIFGQKDSRVDMSCLLSTRRDALKMLPQPIGFTLRGALPDVDVDIFGVLKITDIGIDLTGMRQNAKGDYSFSYGFFGSGAISDVCVRWHITKSGEFYRIMISTQSETWRNVLGVSGLNLQNVLFEADWIGSNISSVTLKLQATFGMTTGLVLLRGVYSKENKELVGVLENCSLDTLKTIYKDLTGRAIDITTDHKVEFSSLLFKVSNQGIVLHGAVEIDEHTSADATIIIGAQGIYISGSVSGFTVGDVEIIDPAISITILDGFNFQLSGRVKFTEEHTFDVSVYVNKSSGETIEYTVYGAYTGEFHTRNVLSVLKDTFLDVSLEQVAICFSNMENPQINIKENACQYPIRRGLQLYATTTHLKQVRDVLGLKDQKPLTICAYWSPGLNSLTGSSFGIDIIMDTTDVLTYGSLRSGPLSMGVDVDMGVGPQLQISGSLYIDVAEQPDSLELKLRLKAGAIGAEGSAAMIGKWNNPLGKCKQLSIADLYTDLRIDYAKFFATGTPTSITLGGTFGLHDFEGRVDLHLGTSYEQLIRLDIQNLDVAKFVKLIANLIEVDISIPDSKDTFYIRKLLVYVSTGIVINGVEHPRGIKLDADMTILGKRATLFADVVETHVKFKGTIESFKLGDFEIRGARATHPSIDLEISRTVQKIFIDGKIMFQKDVWIVVIVDIDVNEGKLFFYFDLKVSDALRVTITASLDGPAPNAIHGKAEGNAKSIDEVLGGTLAEKEFNITGEMNQNMRKYLKELANKILVESGDINRQAQLLNNLSNASAAYEKAKDAFEAEKARLSESVESQTRTIDAELALVRGELDEAQSQYDQNTAVAEQTKRDLQSSLNTKIRDTEKDETAKDLEAVRVAEKAEIALNECRMLWKVLSFAETTARQAKNKKDLSEEDLAKLELRCNEHQAREPPRDAIAHAPWEFAQITLQDELQAKRAASTQAANEYKAALVAHDVAAFEAASAKLTELLKHHQQAQAILSGREAAKAAAIAEIQQVAEEKLHELQKISEASATVLKTNLDLAIEKVETNRASSKTAKEKILQDNDSGNSPQYRDMCEKYDKMVMARNEVESFTFLLGIIAAASPEINDALKYCISAFDNSVLDIKSVKFLGKFGRKGSMAKAHIEATVAGVAQSFDIEFDVRDIVDLVKELWKEITKVITTVAGTIQEIFKQGKEVMDKFVKEAKDGAQIVADETKKFVNNADKELDRLSKEMADDVLNTKDSVDKASKGINPGINPNSINEVDRAHQQLRDTNEWIDDFTFGIFK